MPGESAKVNYLFHHTISEKGEITPVVHYLSLYILWGKNYNYNYTLIIISIIGTLWNLRQRKFCSEGSDGSFRVTEMWWGSEVTIVKR